MSRQRRKRRSVFIDDLQFKLLAMNLLHMLGAILACISAIFLPLVIDLYSDSLSLDAWAEVSRQFLTLNARIWIAVPIVFLFFLLHAVSISHRIAGPLHRFRRICKEVGSGDLSSQLAVRDRDYLINEARALDDMVEALSSKIRNVGERYEEARSALDDLQPGMSRAGSDDAAALASGLKTRLASLGAAVAQFRLREAGGGPGGSVAVPRSVADAIEAPLPGD